MRFADFSRSGETGNHPLVAGKTILTRLEFYRDRTRCRLSGPQSEAHRQVEISVARAARRTDASDQTSGNFCVSLFFHTIFTNHCVKICPSDQLRSFWRKLHWARTWSQENLLHQRCGEAQRAPHSFELACVTRASRRKPGACLFIFPPNCKLVPRSQGLTYLSPGEVVFAGGCRKLHPRTASPAGVVDRRRHPRRSQHLRLSERAPSFGETEDAAGDYAEELAAEMLATTLNVESIPTVRGTRKRNLSHLQQNRPHRQRDAIRSWRQTRTVDDGHRLGRADLRLEATFGSCRSASVLASRPRYRAHFATARRFDHEIRRSDSVIAIAEL